MKFLVLMVLLWGASHGGVMQQHSHTEEISQERTKDGAYSPRDHGHFGGGEHHNEFDHEAILGSHREAQEYDHLPPDEAKSRLEVLLARMDLNKDRFIDRRELKTWILRSFKKLSEEEANDRMEDADEDGDGQITWHEYLRDVYGTDSGESDEDNLQLMSHDKDMWEAADSDKDGRLNKSEWLAFVHPEEHPAMLPVVLRQTLDDKDKDGDGTISFQEYVGDRGHEQDKEWLLAEKHKFDAELDKDHDGKLSANEVLSWIVPSNEEIAEEEVEHLFASSDDDHDDVLSWHEVLEHYDTFVGSEVTDYGDHLHNIHNFRDEL